MTDDSGIYRITSPLSAERLGADEPTAATAAPPPVTPDPATPTPARPVATPRDAAWIPVTQTGPAGPPAMRPPNPPAPPYAAPPPGGGWAGEGGWYAGPGGAHRQRPNRRLRRGLTATAAVAVVAAVGGGVLAGELGGSPASDGVNVAASANLASDQNGVASIAGAVEPAVVTITSIVTGSGSTGYGTTTTPFGGGSGYGQEEKLEGTGMVVTSSGEVVTNNHVIAGASTISVTLHGSSAAHRATVIGTDPTDDIALLQVQGVSGLPTVT